MTKLPSNGRPADEVFAEISERRTGDARWQDGRTFSLVYPASHEVDEVLKRANDMFVFDNALNPIKFPSLRTMTEDVVEMAAGLLNVPDGGGGAMTSGGTESILMATKVARELSRERHGMKPGEGRMLFPRSAHPAFAKAAHVLGLSHSQIALRDDFTADPESLAALLDEHDDVVIVVGSAPGYPHGVVDPIEEMAAMASAKDIPFHTDSCIGGFLLPFVERHGRAVPPFDFRVPGVTSMSADVHKYGYCTKGASVVLYRDKEWLGRQWFVYADWNGGLYGTPAIAGARPAAPIAAAWAVMNFLGEDGYMELMADVLKATDTIQDGIASIPELHVWGEPVASVFSWGSDAVDVMAVNDVMDDKGWNCDRQIEPVAMHVMLSPIHAGVADEFVADLADAVANHGDSRGVEARYN